MNTMNTMDSKDCDQIRDLLEAYALDALDELERSVVEQHIDTCSDCRQRLDAYLELVANLPVALAQVSPHQPPAAVKARLLATISAEKERAAQPSRSSNRRTSPGRFLRRYGYPAAVVLLALAIGLIAHLSVALARERELRETLMHQTELIFEVVDSNQTERVVLLPPDADPEQRFTQPYGKVFTRADMPYIVAMSGRVPAPPPGQAYNLWLITDAGALNAGAMAVDEEGFGSLIYQADQDNPTFDAAHLILQAIDSTTPDGEPLIIWEDE